METQTYTTKSEAETIELGKSFAEKLKKGDVVLFYGDIGVGKTEFIKGICKYFNVEEIVTSPTFTIINQYNGMLNGEEIAIFHIDLYRVKEKKELLEIGFEECLYSADSIKLVEWAENSFEIVKFVNYRILIKADFENVNERLIEITSEN
ncbi:MAG: tRNA (adenosine(37)-N6)-threonylcarbamoyltransferase complex ATPase subunit type 1 TsaE [Ignavibacteria bacterium]|nr:tRNA (adenosine(37)-N6)-threonylcarbamoyltransferase complex ATPase subunit type 1 TsaE [Ignavibacteria bacterium]